MKAGLFIGVYAALFAASLYTYNQYYDSPTVEDAGHLLPDRVKEIEQADGEETLKQLVKQANQTGSRLTIGGKGVRRITWEQS